MKVRNLRVAGKLLSLLETVRGTAMDAVPGEGSDQVGTAIIIDWY